MERMTCPFKIREEYAERIAALSKETEITPDSLVELAIGRLLREADGAMGLVYTQKELMTREFLPEAKEGEED